MGRIDPPIALFRKPPFEKIEILDLVRNFAILNVLGYHLAGLRLVSPEGLHGWIQWAWSRIAYNGSIGVSGFFMVSGFRIIRLIAKGPGDSKTRFAEFLWQAHWPHRSRISGLLSHRLVVVVRGAYPQPQFLPRKPAGGSGPSGTTFLRFPRHLHGQWV